jgi:hypothetical protein
MQKRKTTDYWSKMAIIYSFWEEVVVIAPHHAEDTCMTNGKLFPVAPPQLHHYCGTYLAIWYILVLVHVHCTDSISYEIMTILSNDSGILSRGLIFLHAIRIICIFFFFFFGHSTSIWLTTDGHHPLCCLLWTSLCPSLNMLHHCLTVPLLIIF